MKKNEISLLDALELLNGKFSELSEHFAQGEYAFWLGSAISKERVIGLDGVLSKLIEFLREHSTQEEACPFQRALNDVLEIAKLSKAEQDQIDFSKPASEWPCIDSIVDKLWNSYSEVLSVRVSGKPMDYLLWEGLDFKTTFANQEPDLEHLAIGMLVLEGVVKDVSTANWDGLLEAAMEELGHNGTGYRVTVTGKDFQGPEACATLYKFHGCALRSIENEDVYRPLLVARDLQIIGWMTNESFRMVREQLHALIQRKKTLMIGLSAQDPNIKNLFGGNGEGKVWQWDNHPTPIVFSSLNIGSHQQTLLGVTYGEEAFGANQDEILDRAKFPAYSKSFLTALLLDVLTKKLVTLSEDVKAPSFQEQDFEKINQGLQHLKGQVAQAGDSNRMNLVRNIALTIARARHQLQDGVSEPGRLRYYPLDNDPVHLMKGKQQLASTGLREASAALGIIGVGDKEQKWVTSIGDPLEANSGVLKLSSQNAEARVFFAANDDVITDLIDCGAFNEDDPDAVVICSKRVSPRQQRSPSANLRGARNQPRYVAFGPLLKECDSIDDLYGEFRMEVAI